MYDLKINGVLHGQYETPEACAEAALRGGFLVRTGDGLTALMPNVEIERNLSMTQHTLPLVGAHYRPPAKALLQVIPAGTELILRAEPDNPYDSNAVQVLLATANIPEDVEQDLEMHALGYGFDLAQIKNQEEWHVGYVKATEAQWLQPHIKSDTPCQLGFLMNGNYAVVVEVEDAPAE